MCLVCQASEEADKSHESTDTLKKMVVCQKNGQSLAEADECGKSLTHFKVCQSVSEVPSPAVYGPLLLSSSRRAVPLSNPKVERDISRVYRGVEADVPLVPLFERSSGTWAHGNFFRTFSARI